MKIDDATREALIADGWKAPINYEAYRGSLAAYNHARGYNETARNIREGAAFGKLEREEIEGIAAAIAAVVTFSHD